MAFDVATRYSVIAAVVVLVVGCCVMCVLCCIDYYSAKRDLDDTKTQVSTLTQSEDGRTPRKRKVRIEGDSASDTSSLLDDGKQIKTDRALMDTFVKVLTQGITVKVHSQKDKAPKEVRVTLQSDVLNWKNINSRTIIHRTKSMKIRDIKRIEWGKITETFNSAIAQATPEDICLSLVTNEKTLDLEVSSKVERDSLAQGFTILINAMNQPEGV